MIKCFNEGFWNVRAQISRRWAPLLLLLFYTLYIDDFVTKSEKLYTANIDFCLFAINIFQILIFFSSLARIVWFAACDVLMTKWNHFDAYTYTYIHGSAAQQEKHQFFLHINRKSAAATSAQDFPNCNWENGKNLINFYILIFS